MLFRSFSEVTMEKVLAAPIDEKTWKLVVVTMWINHIFKFQCAWTLLENSCQWWEKKPLWMMMKFKMLAVSTFTDDYENVNCLAEKKLDVSKYEACTSRWRLIWKCLCGLIDIKWLLSWCRSVVILDMKMFRNSCVLWLRLSGEESGCSFCFFVVCLSRNYCGNLATTAKVVIQTLSFKGRLV